MINWRPNESYMACLKWVRAPTHTGLPARHYNLTEWRTSQRLRQYNNFALKNIHPTYTQLTSLQGGYRPEDGMVLRGMGIHAPSEWQSWHREKYSRWIPEAGEKERVSPFITIFDE